MPTWSELLWPATVEWIRFGAVLLGIAAVIGLSELFRSLGHLPAEVSRKSVHILIGTWILFSPRLFISPVPLILLCVIFIAVNTAAIRTGMLKGMHGPKRESLGTVYFPVSFLVLVILFWQRSPELVALAMFSFSIGDAAAAVVGESLAAPAVYSLSGDPKSVQGSLAMFGASLLSVVVGGAVVWSEIHHDLAFLLAMGAAVASLGSAWEALSSKGLDNISVPMSNALVISVFLFPTTAVPVQQLFLAISLGIVIAVLSYRFHFLSLSGSVATAILASIVFGFGGWKWTMPILVFFVFSSLLSFVGKGMKAELESVFEKTSTRDHGQVAANGGIAGILIVLQYAFPSLDLYPMYCGAVAAATADTWGTEIGILSKGRTITLAGFRTVPRGANGGVSLAGSVGGIAGAVLVSIVGAQWTGHSMTAVAALAGGLAGAVTDSLLGATVQAQYQCPTCAKATERRMHCGATTEHTGGLPWLHNDGVNWLCASTGALVAGVVTLLVR